ncbi:MAG: ribonuclease P protein component, partial [Acidimicrobiia bacterium]
YLPGGEGPSRVAYAVARRVGGATERNLVRRRLRHAVRDSSDRFAPGAYLFGVGAGVKSLKFSRLCVAVAGLADEVSGSTTSGTTRRDAAPPGRG